MAHELLAAELVGLGNGAGLLELAPQHHDASPKIDQLHILASAKVLQRMNYNCKDGVRTFSSGPAIN